MTLTEKAVCMIYTGVSFCREDELNAVYEYAGKLLERPVHAHEFDSEYTTQKLKELSKIDFIKICRGIPLDFTLGESDG